MRGDVGVGISLWGRGAPDVGIQEARLRIISALKVILVTLPSPMRKCPLDGGRRYMLPGDTARKT